MLDLLPYVIYFLGPFVLALWLGKRILHANFSAFFIGLFAFFAAWTCNILFTTILSKQTVVFAEGTFLYTVLSSAAAGVFEESSRFLAFRFLPPLRTKRDWRTGIMYAIGHSGMESIIVGGSILLTIAVVKYAPHLLPPELLNQIQQATPVPPLLAVVNACERLIVGLLIHSCFTLVVVLGLYRAQSRWLLVAMLWHFGHDLVGYNLHYLSEHWIVAQAWIAIVLIVYSWLLIRLIRALPNGPPAAASPPAAAARA